MSPDEMADVELAAMAHSAIGQQRKEQNMLNQAKNPYAQLIGVSEEYTTQPNSTPMEDQPTTLSISPLEIDAVERDSLPTIVNDHQV